MPLHDGVDAAAHSKTLHPNDASCAAAGEAASAKSATIIRAELRIFAHTFCLLIW
jgi:hypothetical protein